LTEKLFNALANLIAFGVKGADFFLQGFHEIALVVELSIENADALFCGGSSLTFVLDETDGAGDAVFEGGKVGAAESEIALMVVIHFRVLDVFRDLGFQR